MKICFATNNENKVKEVNALLGNEFEVLSLKAIGCNEELEENQPTIAGNSHQKAKYIHDHFSISVFADDTGLEVSALNGAPGVYSARYAGNERNDLKNIQLLLKNLAGHSDRSAQFKTVITLIINNESVQFEGVVKGRVAEYTSGSYGFGYDPVFIPEGFQCTFAEMSLKEKNKISHRGIAVRKLVEYLKNMSIE